MVKNKDERLAILETKTEQLKTQVSEVGTKVDSLHIKIDTLMTSLSQNYVALATFEEYKKTRLLERVLIVLITASITTLVTFFVVNIIK